MEILRNLVPRTSLFTHLGLLTGAGGVVVQPALLSRAAPGFASADSLGDCPFRLGAASADPDIYSIELRIRLARSPLAAEGGMPQHPALVEWRLALDENMQRVVRLGAVLARPELAHSVHVTVGGLQPSRSYWYQFRYGREDGPVGCARTGHPRDARAARSRNSCLACTDAVTATVAASAQGRLPTRS